VFVGVGGGGGGGGGNDCDGVLRGCVEVSPVCLSRVDE